MDLNLENLKPENFSKWIGEKPIKLGKIENFWEGWNIWHNMSQEEKCRILTEALKQIYYKIMQVKVVNNSNNPLPKYGSAGASGADIYADVEHVNKKFLYDGAAILTDTQILLPPGSRALIPSGIHVNIPEGYEIQVRCRSGMALKQGLIVTNGIGTIDEDYTGDIGVILTNTSKESVIINQGDRIAQLVLMPVSKIEWDLVDSLEETERGEGGFGSTGTH